MQASFIVVGHRREGGFIGEFKRGGAMVGVREVVNFSFGGFAWVVIWLGRGRERWGG